MIKSISEFQEQVHLIVARGSYDNTTINPWFRGQSNCTWTLEPKIYRKKINMGSVESDLLRDFKLNCHSYLDHLPNNDFEWMFIMQHYGLPTRLLDWTESCLIALFFSVYNFEEPENSVVWVLNPWSLNKNLFYEKNKEIPTYEESVLQPYIKSDCNEKYVKANFPIAFRPKRNSLRINAQRGMFTIHGRCKTPLDALNDDKIFVKQKKQNIILDKLVIDKEYKYSILKELFYSGISESVVFPEISGLCNELMFRYSNNFLRNKLV